MDFFGWCVVIGGGAAVIKQIWEKRRKSKSSPFEDLSPITTSYQDTGDNMLSHFKASAIASGYFKPEKISDLLRVLKIDRASSGPISIQPLIKSPSNIYLTTAEKKALGLNTRMKYSKEFIEYFDSAIFKTIEPKSAVEALLLQAYHRVSRQKELEEFKKTGIVKRIQICSCNDVGDCQQVKKLTGSFELNKAPALPLPGCDATFCRCYYSPVFDE